MSGDTSVLLLQQRSRSTEQALPAVEEFFRALALRVRARLVNRSSSNIQVRLASVEIRTLGQLKEDTNFKDTGVYGLLRFDTPRIPAAAALQRPLLTRIIGAMLGDEDGPEEGEDTEQRPLSQVEVRIAQRLFRELTQDLGAVWPLRPAPSIELDGSPGQARLIDQDVASEEVFQAVLDFGPASGAWGLLCITVPTQVLRDSGQRRTDQSGRSRDRPDMGRVMPVEVEVVAEMARVAMRVRDLKKLEVGDLVPLGALDSALLRINGRAVLAAEPGHADGQRSVRVLDRVR
jgi:flagellar motor switch protein FliM